MQLSSVVEFYYPCGPSRLSTHIVISLGVVYDLKTSFVYAWIRLGHHFGFSENSSCCLNLVFIVFLKQKKTVNQICFS